MNITKLTLLPISLAVFTAHCADSQLGGKKLPKDFGAFMLAMSGQEAPIA